MPFNVRVFGGDLPILGALCVVMSALAFVSLLIEHGGARWVGLVWMGFGLALYVGYRTSAGQVAAQRVTVPERALTRRGRRGRVRVDPRPDPRHAARRRHHADRRAPGRRRRAEGEGGAVIEALWVFEVPMALPLDARVPDEELKRARAALARAKAIGEEYEGVEVATATVRARRAGEAIVHEASRRGVEAIVLAAEEPSRAAAACGSAARRACSTRSSARRRATS